MATEASKQERWFEQLELGIKLLPFMETVAIFPSDPIDAVTHGLASLCNRIFGPHRADGEVVEK